MPAGLAGIKAWITAHKAQTAVGAGAAGAVGVGLYRHHKQTGTGNDQVPNEATTAAGTIPYGAGQDVAGGIPYDPTAFDIDPYGYAAQISQGLAELNTTDRAILDAVKIKPTTGGTMTKPHKSPKPTKKPAKPRADGKNTITHHAPPPPRRRKVAAKPRATKPLKRAAAPRKR